MAKQKVVFLHGWATDESVWQNNLLEDYDCQTLLLPGHGKNPTTKWDKPDLSPALDKLQEDTKNEEALIAVGWSLGGQVLIEASTQFKNKFKALILVGVSPRFTKSGDFPYGQSPALVKRMMKDIKADYAETIKRFYGLNFTEEELQKKVAQSFIKLHNDKAEYLDSSSIYNSLDALYNLDLRDKLNKIETPTLIVHGSRDTVCPVETSKFLKDNLTNSTLKIFNNSGHAPFITESSQFNSAITSFIENNNDK